MMTPHEFFRAAAGKRRLEIVCLKITGGEGTLQELVAPEPPVSYECIPQKEANTPYIGIKPSGYHIKN